MQSAMANPPTILDIAREAGVSPSTVSRVLNGTTPVADDKRDAVNAAVKKLRYRPNASAQGLVWGRTRAVGVLTQSIASPFYGDILRGIEEGLAGSDYHAVFTSGNWHTDAELAALNLLAGRRVDALIMLAGVTPDAQLRQMAAELPLVVIGRSVPGIERQCLRIDDIGAAEEATRYLIELGHRRVVHISGPDLHQDARDRRAGYARALAQAGIAADPHLLIAGDYTELSGLVAVETLLGGGVHFTAIFAANDQMAYGARLALYRRGIRVPEDISLVGFDDLLGSAYTTPPLTTVRQPAFELGCAAGQAIRHLLEGRSFTLPALSTELVIRESAGPLRA